MRLAGCPHHRLVAGPIPLHGREGRPAGLEGGSLVRRLDLRGSGLGLRGACRLEVLQSLVHPFARPRNGGLQPDHPVVRLPALPAHPGQFELGLGGPLLKPDQTAAQFVQPGT